MIFLTPTYKAVLENLGILHLLGLQYPHLNSPEGRQLEALLSQEKWVLERLQGMPHQTVITRSFGPHSEIHQFGLYVSHIIENLVI